MYINYIVNVLIDSKLSLNEVEKTCCSCGYVCQFYKNNNYVWYNILLFYKIEIKYSLNNVKHIILLPAFAALQVGIWLSIDVDWRF